MPNVKARNTAAKRLHKIDHFLNLIEKMSPHLDSNDCGIVAEYLTRRVRMVCNTVLKSDSKNLINIKVKVKGEPSNTDIYCSRCRCWHDPSLHKGNDSGDLNENTL